MHLQAIGLGRNGKEISDLYLNGDGWLGNHSESKSRKGLGPWLSMRALSSPGEGWTLERKHGKDFWPLTELRTPLPQIVFKVEGNPTHKELIALHILILKFPINFKMGNTY